MEPWLLVFTGIMAVIIIALFVKIYFLRKAAREIETAFADRLITDTNTLIDISTGDKYMKSLANGINSQLRILRTERHRFRQGDWELKEAVTNISHDLRTPLTAICGYLDLLEREEISEAARRYLSQIENRTEAMKTLTDELFQYSVATSSQALKTERLDVVRVLEDCLLSFYGVMQEKEIYPNINLPEAPIYRELDASALRRVFSNIISNATKYSDGDFAVTMTADGSITFVNSAKALDAVTVGRLFDRFYTVDAGRNSTGLGLSIAKLLTERLGGSIEAAYESQQLHIIVKL